MDKETNHAKLMEHLNIYKKAMQEGNYDNALVAANTTLDLAKNIFGEDDSNTATYYNNLAIAYYHKGEFDKSIELYERSLKICLTVHGEEHPYTASSYHNLGLVYYSKGGYEKAIDYYEKALAIILKISGEDIASIYNSLGAAYEKKDQYDKAIEYFEKSLEIKLKTLGENHPDIAISYINLGTVFNSKGEYKKAINYYEKSLTINLKAIGLNHPILGKTYNNLGRAYADKGNYDMSIEYHKKSLAVKLKTLGETHPDVAVSYNNLGAVYKSKGEYEKAIEYFGKSLAIFKKLPADKFNHLTTYSSLSNSYSLTKNIPKQISTLEEAIALILQYRLELGRDKEFFMEKNKHIFDTLYKLYIDTDQPEKAFEVSEKMRGLSLLENFNLKFALTEAKIPEKNAKTILNAYTKLEALFSTQSAAVHSNHPNKENILKQISLQIAEQEKAKDELDGSLMKQNSEYARLRTTKVASASEFQKKFSDANKTFLQFTLIKDPDTQKETLYAFVLGKNVNKHIKLGEDVDLIRRVENLRLLMSAYPDRRKFIVLKHKDTKKELLIDYTELPKDEEGSKRFEQGKEMFRKELDLKNSTPEKKIYKDKYIGTQDRKMEQQEANALMQKLQREIYDIVFAPILDTVGTGLRPVPTVTSNEIVISPDGALYTIPFNALLDNQNKLLMEKYSFTLIPSATIWDKLHRKKEREYKHPFFALGNAVYSSGHGDGTKSARGKRSVEDLQMKLRKSSSAGLDDLTMKNLPGSAEELREISKMAYNVENPKEHTLNGLSANKEELFERFNSRDREGEKTLSRLHAGMKYRFVHFSVHGLFFGETPELNSLALTGRKSALAYRKEDLRKYEETRKKPLTEDAFLKLGETIDLGIESELIVMSACETSLGTEKAGEGLVGLPQGFLMGGSNYVMATLWSVDDKGTMLFMKEFYKRAFSPKGKKKKVIELLRETQSVFAAKKNGLDYTDPFYWAPFAVYGR